MPSPVRPIVKLKRLRRRINAGAANSLANKVDNVRASHERYVFRHTRYKFIVAALREGHKPAEVARYFAEQGWIDIHENTFREYLATFRRLHPEIIDQGDKDTIDSLVPTNLPDVDPERELSRLLRLQKLRLKIDVETEKNIGKLLSSTVKEVEATQKILETMLKARGKIGATAAPVEDDTDQESRDALRHLRTDETARDRMYNLTTKLVGALSRGAKEKAEA